MMVENDGATQQRLPGLPYTPDQLFFVATGQVYNLAILQFMNQAL